MDIYGIDFTSVPSRRKPIICVLSRLESSHLHVDRLLKIASLNEFEVFLKRKGPWVAGFDFPFGLPRPLVTELGWPPDWPGYVAHIATLSQQEFEAQITAYRNSKPAGRKHLKRAADVPAKAISPMMLVGVPVGKMFFKGAPRLLRAGLCVLPCHPISDNRIALEAYPAMVARKWLGQPPKYKNDTPKKQTDAQAAARRNLFDAVTSPQLAETYGLTVTVDDLLVDEVTGDPTADSLDALLCAIQAGWAYLNRADNFGIPPTADPTEGWIIDPELLSSA